MMLITKEIAEKLKPIGSTSNMKLEDIKVPLKFFNPYGIGTWWIWEWDGKDEMYGIAELSEKEVGYVSFKELQELKVPPFGLGIERDKFWDQNTTAHEVMYGAPVKA